MVTEKNKITMDLTPFVAFSFANNKLLEKEISRLYEKDKFKAYEVATISEHYNSQLLTDGGIQKQILGRKALGLIELDKLNYYNESIVLTLFKKGWKAIYNYITNIDNVDFSYIMKTLITGDHTDDYYVGCCCAMIYLSVSMDKSIKSVQEDIDPFDELIKILYLVVENYKIENRFLYSNIKNNKEYFLKAIAIKDRFFELIEGQLNNTSDLVPYLFEDEDLARFSNSLNLIFDSEDMMFSSITNNMKISVRDIVELSYLYYSDNKNKNRLEAAKFIITGLFIKYLIKAYKELKEYYFKNNKETMYFEIDKLTEQSKTLESENSQLKTKIEVLTKENERLKKDYKNSIEKENILLKNEIEKLKNNIVTLDKEKVILKEVTEILFTIDNDINDFSSMPRDYEEIACIKAIIAGGNSNWHNNIKDILPDTFTFIDGFNERFDEKVLDNKDIVFIYTKVMSHAFWYKLINRCKKQNITYVYINSTSPDKLKNELIRQINKTKNPVI